MDWDIDWANITSFVQDFEEGPWDAPFRIALILLIAFIISSIAGRLISRLVRRTVSRGGQLDRKALRNLEDSEELSESLLENRVAQRAYALGALARSAVVITVWSVAILMVLSEVGLNIGPVLTSAGVLGVVIGFGAQTLVADYLAGIAMTLEDQLGVGDVVDCGVVLGTVEDVTLRYTRIRDFFGVVWYVRNGTIAYIANQSQGWTYGIVDIALPYDSDLKKVAQVVNDSGKEMALDHSLDDVLIDPPVYAGLEDARGDAVVIRVMAKVVPDQQFIAARVMRERIKGALDAAGIHIPLAQMQIVENSRHNVPKE